VFSLSVACVVMAALVLVLVLVLVVLVFELVLPVAVASLPSNGCHQQQIGANIEQDDLAVLQ
jgi:hypothetical protein